MTVYGPEADSLELLARAIFTKVLGEPGASGDLLWRLFNGDGVTMDPLTREIVFLPAAALAEMSEPEPARRPVGWVSRASGGVIEVTVDRDLATYPDTGVPVYINDSEFINRGRP